MLGFFKQRAANSKLVSYAEVIRAATDLFDPSFEAKGVRVIVNLPHSLPGVSVSVDELQEVLINLLENEREALGRDTTCMCPRKPEIFRSSSGSKTMALDWGSIQSGYLKPSIPRRARARAWVLPLQEESAKVMGESLQRKTERKEERVLRLFSHSPTSTRSDENLSGRG